MSADRFSSFGGGEFYQPAGLEKAHQYGLEIAARLLGGSSTIKPSDASSFLLYHELEAGSPAINEQRKQLARDLDVLAPSCPPSSAKATEIAARIYDIVSLTNASAIILAATDVVMAESLRLSFGTQGPDQ